MCIPLDKFSSASVVISELFVDVSYGRESLDGGRERDVWVGVGMDVCVTDKATAVIEERGVTVYTDGVVTDEHYTVHTPYGEWTL